MKTAETKRKHGTSERGPGNQSPELTACSGGDAATSAKTVTGALVALVRLMARVAARANWAKAQKEKDK
jgi:hypothetical protein